MGRLVPKQSWPSPPKVGKVVSVDRSGLTLTPDERSGGAECSQIISRDKESEDQRLPAQKASMSGVMAYVTECGLGPTGECFCSLKLGSIFTCISVSSSSDEDAGDTGGRESESAEASRGMCYYNQGVGFPLTYTSQGESPEGHSNGGSRWIQSPQSHPRGHPRRLC